MCQRVYVSVSVKVYVHVSVCQAPSFFTVFPLKLRFTWGTEENMEAKAAGQ